MGIGKLGAGAVHIWGASVALAGDDCAPTPQRQFLEDFRSHRHWFYGASAIRTTGGGGSPLSNSKGGKSYVFLATGGMVFGTGLRFVDRIDHFRSGTFHLRAAGSHAQPGNAVGVPYRRGSGAGAEQPLFCVSVNGALDLAGLAGGPLGALAAAAFVKG